MLELKPKPMVNRSQGRQDYASKQPRRLLLALTLLLVALVAVIIRDHEFWFGSDDSGLDGEPTTSEVAQPTVKTPSAATTEAKSTATHVAKKSIAAPRTSAESTVESGTAITATRTVLPPLDVEVIAGDSHRTVHPGSNATHVEITKPGAAAANTTLAATTNAAERERLSSPTGTYAATYPLLAQHMNVEGSVVLQALINAEGIIQNLHVLSGPAILASAAEQAVREWKFKPVTENGQAVETKAMITVNFAIKVADSSSKDTIATSMPLRYTYTGDGASR
jgi:TonB family protein